MPQTETWWQSQTFKALVLYFVTMVANAVARRWGYALATEEIAGLTVTVVGFIMGRQYKQGKLLDNEIHPLQVLPPSMIYVPPPMPLPVPAKDAPPSASTYKPVVGLLLACSLLVSGSGCAWWQSQPKLRADLSACATGVVVGEVEALMGEAAKVMQGAPATWDAHLDQLVARGGQAALCAIMALADALAGGTGGTETDPLADYDRATRAAYLRIFARGAALR